MELKELLFNAQDKHFATMGNNLLQMKNISAKLNMTCKYTSALPYSQKEQTGFKIELRA